jgi:hypothetical protein
MAVAFVAIAALTVFAIVSIFNKHGGLAGADARCKEAAASCAVVSGVLLTIVPISIAVIWVLVWRLDRVRRAYRREAQQHPDRLLDTDLATDEIVGRDDLCHVLQDDLWSAWEDSGSATEASTGRQWSSSNGHASGRRAEGKAREGTQRRPVVLVGDVGIGKTAVLARLTQVLAERGAVPVAIRLRSAPGEQELDLLDRARRKFLATAPVRSEAEGDKIWRRLRDNDQAVIVADGLEEALMDVDQKRETSIRRAIENVRRSGVAIIISSRQQEALSHLDASMTKLEPLDPQAAVQYILRGSQSADGDRVRLIVEKGDVTEAPIFMVIARELQDIRDISRVDTREADRLGIRVKLLDHWKTALSEGRIRPDAPVTPADRARAIENLETLALVGLGEDSLEVRFDLMGDLLRITSQSSDQEKNVAEAAKDKLRAAAADCERLGLVNALPAGLRFQHSILQAYFGSQAIRRALSDDPDAADAVTRGVWQQIRETRNKTVGRELLIALEMSCVNCEDPNDQALTRLVQWATRTEVESPLPASKAVGAAGAAVSGAAAQIRSDGRLHPSHDMGPAVSAQIVETLRSVKRQTDPDDAAPEPHLEDLLVCWRDANTRDTNSADSEAFLAARLEAVPRLSEAHQYKLLWNICRTTDEYPVRLAAARALGAGGAEAFEFLSHDDAWTRVTDAVKNDRRLRNDEDGEERLFALCGWLLPQLRVSISKEREDAESAHRELLSRATDVVPALANLPETMHKGGSHGDESRRQVGARTPVASSASEAIVGERLGVATPDETERPVHYAGASASTKEVDNLLKAWVRRTCESGQRHVGRQMSLAQGFRHAANTKQLDPQTRGVLSAYARQLLGDETFWYARIAVIQALTLWLLADLADDPQGGDLEYEAVERVHQWARRRPHPFVEQVADLCAKALRTGQPANYVWIDEAVAVRRLGSGRRAIRYSTSGELWIPSYAGWLSLAPEAQRLVAEIVILINLADRGRTVLDRDERLAKTARDDLPLCMTTKGGRPHMHVERKLHERKAPGADCIAGCEFDLCPYPSLADELSRGELTEAFCRQQRALLEYWRALQRPAWQKDSTRDELRHFWSSLERRRRGGVSS